MRPARVALYVTHRGVAGIRGSVRHPRPVGLSRSVRPRGGHGPPSGVGALYVISARPVQLGPVALYVIYGPGGGSAPPRGTSSSVRHLLPPGGARPPESGVGALYVISARLFPVGGP